MSVVDTLHTGVKALVRTGRSGASDVQWSDPFVCGLYLQRDAKGQVCLLGLCDVDFAEFDPRHDCETDRLLMTEDYFLEILEAPVAAV